MNRPAIEAEPVFKCSPGAWRIAIAWEMGKAAYEKAGNLFDSPNLVLEIPFAHADSSRGDRAESIRSYLRLPKGPQPATGWPVLLFICGLDAYKTDNTPRIEKHIAQGFTQTDSRSWGISKEITILIISS